MKAARMMRRGGISRGALAAIGVALVPLVLVGWFVLRGSKAGTGSSGELPEGLEAPELAPGAGAGTRIQDSLADKVKNATVQIVDRDDPTRVAAELILDLEPLEARRYLVTRPQGWFYLRDGRVIHLQADKGRLYIPDAISQQPESGTLEGNVVGRLYAAPVGAKRPDLERDEPLGRLDTDSLTFDMALGELSTPDRVVVTSAAVDFAGRGVSMLLNEVRERAELIEVRQGEYIVHRPRRTEAREESAPVRQADATADERPESGRGGAPGADARPTRVAGGPAGAAEEDRSGPAKEPAATAEETLYAIVFSRDVTVSRGSSTARGDKLEVWARLIGNELPEGAIAPIRTVSVGKPEGEKSEPAAEPVPDMDAALAADDVGEMGEDAPVRIAAGEAGGQPASTDGGAAGEEGAAVVAAATEDDGGEEAPITLRWTGPCVIRPLAHLPPELEKDHVALRFTAEQSGLVRFEDAEQGASGHCAVLDYAATTRRMVIAGPGPESVLVQTPEHRMATVRAEADLANGLIFGPSPVVLSVTRGVDGEGRPRVQQVSCTNDYSIALRMQDGALTNSLQQAIFNGNVRATEPGSSIAGDSLRAEFETTPGRANSISRLRVEGSVLAQGRDGDQIESRLLDVAFRPGEDGSPEPTDVTAEGSVLAQREGERIACDRLDATLARREDGRVSVASALAQGNVRFASKKDGVTAEADTIRAEPPRELVELVGERAVLTRGEASRVTGTQMRLDGAARRMEVFGAGTFEHRETAGAGGSGANIVAEWATAMDFDDGTGVLECVGEAVATSSPDALSLDTVKGDRVRVELEPRTDEAAGSQSAAAPPWGESGEGREVLRAIAYGGVLEREGGENAKIESRRYAAADATGARGPLERLLYLEGPTIVADNAAGTLDVAHPGRMMVMDARQAETDGAGGNQERLRGSTLFEWAGSMRMRREAGTVDMRRRVRMTHRRLADGEITDLESERLTATVRAKEGATGPEGVASGELVAASASGAVYVRSGTKELIADHLEYDARAGKAVATAAPGGVVTMFDEQAATPVTAARLMWDMVRDRVEVSRPGPVVAPR